ncbi:transglutaminase [Streptomyces rimosus subsp. pseudoverticillatus]|uniref:transglutaminaseTgpA domain-containing protein n=1 Tax=Streptomyces rimosus TaxID=1927 RepID=UPI0006B2A522|nr:transglutaminaseTgpA domain-containing protein [Streptomyces rimosus]KOT78769.1 transglutaminase [Streptomyces rimosus subsp. pseudoverticillatus]
MSGRARLTVCAVVATLGASCALLPLVDPVGWMLQAAILLTIVSGVGALARRVPLARPLTVVAQAVVALLLLTVLFAHDKAIALVLPGPDVFAEFGELVQEGVADVSRYAIPAPVTAGIRLLLVGGVLVVGLIVDALAVTYRSAAPAGLPLLALYSVAAGLSQGGAGWLWFLVAGAGYLLLLLAEGRDRLSQWGRVFGGRSAGSGRPAFSGGQSYAGTVGGPAQAPVRTGRRIGALVLGVALVVPAVLPSLGGGLLGQAVAGRGPGGGGGTISAVNPLVSLQNSLNQPEDRQVLNYRTTASDTRDMYLRIVALDQFDGTAWKPSERAVKDVPDRLPEPAGLSPEVDVTPVNTSISTAPWYAQNWLPLPYPASRVDIAGRWRFEPEGRTLVGDRGQNTRGVQYQVESLLVRPTARQLEEAPASPAELAREYTKVPDSLPPVVRETAKQVTKGARTAYDKAVRLQDWFSLNGGFTYNTEVRAGSGTEAISRFLEQKEGFCVHFAFSMAAMARTLGIPARVAVGFTPGTRQSDGSTSVGLKDAHAWPELYFEGTGWTRFEPTPSRGTLPDYTLTNTPSNGGTNAPAPQPSRSAAAPVGPSPAQSCAPAERRVGPCWTPPAQSTSGPAEGGPSPWTVAAIVIGIPLLLLLLLLPVLWRLRTRSRRLGGGVAGRHRPGTAAAPDLRTAHLEPDDSGWDGGGAPESRGGIPAGATRTLAAWQELVDSGWDYGILPDESLTPRKAAERIVRIGELRAPAAESAHRVAASVEQVLYAPHPQPAPGLADEVRRVRTGLHDAASRRLRLRALLAPRSAARALWTLSSRWSAFLARCATSPPATAVRKVASALRLSRERT